MGDPLRIDPGGGNPGWTLSPDGSRLAIGLLTATGGDVWVKQLPNGPLSRVTFDSGPDLRVYLSSDDPASGDLGDFEDLGELKGNVGNQQYTVPRGLDLQRFSTVVVWCRAFSVAFTSARLERS